MVYIAKDRGQGYKATTVTAIEIRRGLDKAIEEASDEVSGDEMAQMLIDHVEGRNKGN